MIANQHRAKVNMYINNVAEMCSKKESLYFDKPSNLNEISIILIAKVAKCHMFFPFISKFNIY